jgi:hypothetical protein
LNFYKEIRYDSCFTDLIPLVTGLAGFFFKSEVRGQGWALLSSLATLVIALGG